MNDHAVWRARIAQVLRHLGIGLMIVIGAAATYLEWTGSLDLSLMPYFLAVTVYCLVDVAAMAVESERAPSRRRRTAR